MQRKSSLFAAAALSAGMIASQAMAGGSMSDQINGMNEQAMHCLENFAAKKNLKTMEFLGNTSEFSVFGNMICRQTPLENVKGMLTRSNFVALNPDGDNFNKNILTRTSIIEITSRKKDFTGPLSISNHSYFTMKSNDNDVLGIDRLDKAQTEGFSDDFAQSSGQKMSMFLIYNRHKLTLAEGAQVGAVLDGSDKSVLVKLTANDRGKMELANDSDAATLQINYSDVQRDVTDKIIKTVKTAKSDLYGGPS